LDPVYSGKALYYFSQEMHQTNTFKSGDSILFIHTGGFFGLYDKINELSPIIRSLTLNNEDENQSCVKKLQIKL
jgi:hypothetical protein